MIYPPCPIHGPKDPLDFLPSVFGKKLAFCTCSKGQTPKNNSNEVESQQQATSSDYSRHDYYTYRDSYEFEPKSTAHYSSQTSSQWAHDRYERAEKEAMNLKSLADRLFMQGEYVQAESLYRRACDQSSFFSNMDEAKIGEGVTRSIRQGDHYILTGNYGNAQSEYSQAYYKSQTCWQRRIFSDRLTAAQIERDAEKLDSDGQRLFETGKYSEAYQKFCYASSKSIVTAGYYEKYHKQCGIVSNSSPRIASEIYTAHRNEAKTEVDAESLNSQGDILFKEGKYSEAETKYREAHRKSKVKAQSRRFKANVDKAKIEIDAKNLSAQGDVLLEQNKYTEALNRYQEAHDKTQVVTKRKIYTKNIDEARAMINKIALDKLWERAWDAECDMNNDRFKEAQELFQKVFSESELNLKIFSGNSKFEQYKILAVLKIEGNEIFNQGLESQQNGIILFRAAIELNQKEKYELANEKYKGAKKYFQEALEKFERGSKSDQRFSACVGFIQDLINVVIDSIKITEQCMFSDRLNKLEIASDNHSGAPSCETDVTGKHINYSQHM